MRASSFEPTGFTLVELLLASTMIAILVVGLAQHLQGGIGVWRKATRVGEHLQRQRVAMDRMARDFANAFVYNPNGEDGPSVVFEAGRMQWVCTQPGRSQENSVVRVVSYSCMTQPSGADSETRWFARSTQSVREAMAGRQPQWEFLLSGCEDLTFQYAYLPAQDTDPLEWHPSWSSPIELPQLVELTLRIGKVAPIHRVFRIPVGVLKAFALGTGQP